MTAPHRLSRRDARRIAVRAQLLGVPRPTDLLAVVRHLGVLQADPATAVAPSAEIVVWSRLGASYRLGGVEAARQAGDLVELEMMLRPAEDLALFRAEMAAWPGGVRADGELKDWEQEQQHWIEANDECRLEILEKLHDEGPLTARDLPDTTLVPWQSSGWNDARNVRMLLGLMVRRGEVAAAGTQGRDRLWDLAERVYPDVPEVPLEAALHARAVRRLHALGIARARTTEMPGGEQNFVGEVGEPAVVDGVRGQWRVDPAYLGGEFRGRVALLSPLDRLVVDRTRMAELFEFDYQLEMYKPAAKRRWGYWAMPILHGDRLVGKLDATAERDTGVLRVDVVHEDGTWTRAIRTGVDRELRDLARWLDLELTGAE